MKLSILIPTYNYDCTELVAALHRQLPDDGEIIVGDDGSTNAEVLSRNRELCRLRGVTVWESTSNLGRAGMCNALIRRAQGEYLLITDADAQVPSDSFLRRYLDETPTCDVVCGGTLHPDRLPSRQVSLRWRYEKYCEPHKTVERRNESPYRSFNTFNIFIPRRVALAHPFDETITRYGYEDTLLGRQLELAGVGVRHIDNPLVHLGLDANERFLAKTEEAMRTLLDISDKIGDHAQIVVAYRRLKALHLSGLCALCFRLTRPLLKRNLLGGKPCIPLFQFYKLGYFCQLATLRAVPSA